MREYLVVDLDTGEVMKEFSEIQLFSALEYAASLPINSKVITSNGFDLKYFYNAEIALEIGAMVDRLCGKWITIFGLESPIILSMYRLGEKKEKMLLKKINCSKANKTDIEKMEKELIKLFEKIARGVQNEKEM